VQGVGGHVTLVSHESNAEHATGDSFRTRFSSGIRSGPKQKRENKKGSLNPCDEIDTKRQNEHGSERWVWLE